MLRQDRIVLYRSLFIAPIQNSLCVCMSVRPGVSKRKSPALGEKSPNLSPQQQAHFSNPKMSTSKLF